MVKRKSKNFRIESGQKGGPAKVDAAQPKTSTDDKVNVSLRYYQRGFECFSDWQQTELKAFSAWVEKMQARTPAQVTSTTQTCHCHKGKKKPLPSGLSPEQNIYGIDVGRAGRVHGVFSGETFFLVWLDRRHQLLEA